MLRICNHQVEWNFGIKLLEISEIRKDIKFTQRILEISRIEMNHTGPFRQLILHFKRIYIFFKSCFKFIKVKSPWQPKGIVCKVFQTTFNYLIIMEDWVNIEVVKMKKENQQEHTAESNQERLISCWLRPETIWIWHSGLISSSMSAAQPIYNQSESFGGKLLFEFHCTRNKHK